MKVERTCVSALFLSQTENIGAARASYGKALEDGTLNALLALAHATHYSLSAHAPSEAIASKLSCRDHSYVKKSLKEILKMGLAMRHPTEGGMTFQLTKTGLRLVEVINCFEEQSFRGNP